MISAENSRFRSNYFKFVSSIFPSVSFEKWHELGFWESSYRPYTLIHSGEIVANVSVALMDVFFKGRNFRAAQLGAVGTLPHYRLQGLSRQLINYVLEKYQKTVDLFFLFANDSVLDFYPRFGFRPVNQNIWQANLSALRPDFQARQLNLNNTADFKLVQNCLKNRRPMTKIFGAENYQAITMWHLLNIYPDNIFYLDSNELIFILKSTGDCLHLYEIIFQNEFDFSAVLPKFIQSQSSKRITFYFPPDQVSFQFDLCNTIDSGLFVKGLFPSEIEPFHLPVTAVT